MNRRRSGATAVLIMTLCTTAARTASAQFVVDDPIDATPLVLRPAAATYYGVAPTPSGFAVSVGFGDESSVALLDSSGVTTAPPVRDPIFSNRVSAARIAATASGLLLFGYQSISGDLRLRVQRVDRDGAFVSTGTAIASVPVAAGDPRHNIACSAVNCLLVWQAGTQINGVRVTHTGALIDATPTILSVTSASEIAIAPAVASDGTNFLVAYGKYENPGVIRRGVWVQLVDGSAGTLRGAPVRAGADSTAPTLFPNMQVTSHNNRYAVAWLLGAPVIRVFDGDAVPVSPDATTLDLTADVPAGTSRSARGIIAIAALSDERFGLAWHLNLVNGSTSRDAIFARAVSREQLVLGTSANTIDPSIGGSTAIHLSHGVSSAVLFWTRYPEGSGRPAVQAAARLDDTATALDAPPLVSYRIPPTQLQPRLTRLSDGTSLLVFEEQFGFDPADGATAGLRAVRFSAQGARLTPTTIALGAPGNGWRVAAADGQFLIVRTTGGSAEYRRFANDLRPIDAAWQRSVDVSDPAVESVADSYLMLNFGSAGSPGREGFLLDGSGTLTPQVDPFPSEPLALAADGRDWLMFLQSSSGASSCNGVRMDRAGRRTSFTWPRTPTSTCALERAISDPWGTALLARDALKILAADGSERRSIVRGTVTSAELARAPAVTALAEVQFPPFSNQVGLAVVPDDGSPTTQRNLFSINYASRLGVSIGENRVFIAYPEEAASRLSVRMKLRVVHASWPAASPLDAATLGDATADSSDAFEDTFDEQRMPDSHSVVDADAIDSQSDATSPAIDASLGADVGLDHPLHDTASEQVSVDGTSADASADAGPAAPPPNSACACRATAPTHSRRHTSIRWLGVVALALASRRARAPSVARRPRV